MCLEFIHSILNRGDFFYFFNLLVLCFFRFEINEFSSENSSIVKIHFILDICFYKMIQFKILLNKYKRALNIFKY